LASHIELPYLEKSQPWLQYSGCHRIAEKNLGLKKDREGRNQRKDGKIGSDGLTTEGSDTTCNM
jgi:hypothetical protein